MRQHYFNQSAARQYSAIIGAALFLAFASGCSIRLVGDFSDVSESGLEACAATEAVTVAAAYPGNGANWNDYVENTEADFHNLADTACNADGTIDGGSRNGEFAAYNACLHGGAIRRVDLANQSSCTGLTLTESLGAFNWFCVDHGATVSFFSNGLKAEKRLADLLNAAGNGWRDNQVSITNTRNCLVAESTAMPWHSNTVRNLNDASIDNATLGNTAVAGVVAVTNTNTTAGGTGVVDTYRLDGNSIIWTVTSAKAFAGLILTGTKSALVIYEGARVQKDFSGNTNCTNGTVGATNRCVVATEQDYNWFEGELWIDFQYDEVIRLYGSSFTTIRHHQSIGGICCTIGINLAATSTYNRIDQAQLINHPNAIHIDDAASQYNAFTNMTVSNGRGYALRVQGFDNTFVNLLAANMDGNALGTVNTHRNSFHNFTLAGNTAAINIANGADMTFTSMIITNSTNNGVNLSGNNRSYFGNLAITDNSSIGIYLPASVINADFRYKLLVGNNDMDATGADCENTNVSNDLAAGQTACADAGANFTRITGKSLVGSFKGQVTNGQDTENASVLASLLNGSGYLAYASITDWFDFQSIYRAWGPGLATTPLNPLNQGECASGTSCAIWDWTLSASDPNGFLDINGQFQNGQACPTSVDGTETVTDGIQNRTNTYLINAFERVSDGIGDDDGLCESDEACIYSPQFGAYQGHGSLGECDFNANGGTVTGVTMYGYLQNGT